mgnify:CR=1 FL=1
MRLDHYLVLKNQASTRSKATDLIKRGLVLVNGKPASKPGQDVQKDDHVEVLLKSPYVSRAGEKLDQAFKRFNLSVMDKTVLDIGSSTGGFTDCCLQQGAKHVMAVDVGKDQMDQRLANDPRVILREGTNILNLEIPIVDVILVDVSFTSIKPILHHLKGFKGQMVLLLKPQFEAGNIRFKKGVLKDKKIHLLIAMDIIDTLEALGFTIAGFMASPLKGKEGNQEYLIYIDPNKPINDIRKQLGEHIC